MENNKVLIKSFDITSVIKNKRCREGIRNFLLLKDSTTNYFERLTGMVIKVSVLKQLLENNNNNSILYRESLLYLNNANLPIAYCICRISKSMLEAYEFEQIQNGCRPLGKILGIDEDRRLSKGKIDIESVYNDELSDRLCSSKGKCFIKKYNLFFDNNVICIIKEIVNVESFSRLLKMAL